MYVYKFFLYQLYKSVENLDLQNNNITEKGTNYLLARAEYLEIKYLNLKANKFGVQNNTCLRALHLQKYNFSCHDIENMISNAKYNNTLYLLDLGNNNIGDHGVEHITSWLIKRPALKTLILCRNIITDHGARSSNVC